MNDRMHPDTLTDRRDLAAYWHARHQSGDMTAQEQATFQQWLAADPANARQYDSVLALWRMADKLPAQAVARLGTGQASAVDTALSAAAGRTGMRRGRRSLGGTDTEPVRSPRRQVFQWGLGLAVACGLVWGAAAMLDMWQAPALYQAEYVTAHGEQKQWHLPDGSILALNTDTAATVAFFEDRRVVHLAQGEVFLQVQRNRDQPFIVDVDSGQVEVTGTQFNVRRDDPGFSVGVLEGSVQVSSGPWWQRSTAGLTAGQRGLAQRPGELQVSQAGDLESALAWREGKVVFRGALLSDAVRELNRYADRRLVLAGAQTGQLRVSGIFDTADLSSFLAALPHIVPVSVHQGGQGPIEIRLR